MFDELDTNTQQYVQEPQEQQKAQEQPAQESNKEYNLRVMRERAESAERRSAELERMMQMNMSQSQQPKTKIQLVDEEDDFDVNDDDYVDGKKYKKQVKTLRKEAQENKQRLEEIYQKITQENAEVRLKSQFSDFDSVVNKENIERLASQKPALYRSILANPDIYDRGYTAYELIKNSGMISNEYAQQDRRLEDNRSKPRSSANASPQVGETPLARVGDYDRRILTPERILQLNKQVAEAKRNK